MKRMTAKVDIAPVTDCTVGGMSTLLQVAERSSARKRNAVHQNMESYHDIVSTMFEYNTEVMEEFLIKSAKKGDLAQIALILQRRAEVLFNIDAKDPATGNTALMWAAYNGHSKIVQLLLRHGADVTIRNHDDITAVELSLPLVRQMLLESVEQGGAQNSLCQAAWQGNVSILKKLLAQNTINVNCRNADHLSPILLATRDIHLFEKLGSYASGANYSPVEVIKELLKHGVDLTAADESEMTALHYICSSGSQSSYPIAVYLLKAGACPDARDRNCSTPLHYASQRGNTEIVGALLDGGADPNAKDLTGTTPLHLTARHGHDQATLVLVQHGADIFVANEDGYTPLDVAKNKAIMLTLRQAWMSSTKVPENSVNQLQTAKTDGGMELDNMMSCQKGTTSKEANSSLGNPNYSRHLMNNEAAIQPSEASPKFDQQKHGPLNHQKRSGSKGMACRPTAVHSPRGQRKAPCQLLPDKNGPVLNEKTEDTQKPSSQSERLHFLPHLSRNSPSLAAVTAEKVASQLRSSEEKPLAVDDLFPDVIEESKTVKSKDCKPGSAKFPKPSSCPVISQITGVNAPSQSPQSNNGCGFMSHNIPHLASIFFTDIDQFYRNSCQKEEPALKIIDIDGNGSEDWCTNTVAEFSLHSKTFKSILREGDFNIDETRVHKSSDSGYPDEGTANSNTASSTSSSNSNFSTSLDIAELSSSGQKSSLVGDGSKRALIPGSGAGASKTIPEVNSESCTVSVPSSSADLLQDTTPSSGFKMTQIKSCSPVGTENGAKPTSSSTSAIKKGNDSLPSDEDRVNKLLTGVKTTVVLVKPPSAVKPIETSFITNNMKKDYQVTGGKTSSSAKNALPEMASLEAPKSVPVAVEELPVAISYPSQSTGIKIKEENNKIGETAAKFVMQSASRPLPGAEKDPTKVKDSFHSKKAKEHVKTADLKKQDPKTITGSMNTGENLANPHSRRSASCGPAKKILPSAVGFKDSVLVSAESKAVKRSSEQGVPKQSSESVSRRTEPCQNITKKKPVKANVDFVNESEVSDDVSNATALLTRHRSASFRFSSYLADRRANLEASIQGDVLKELDEKSSYTVLSKSEIKPVPNKSTVSISESHRSSLDNLLIPQSQASLMSSGKKLSSQKHTLPESLISANKSSVQHQQPIKEKLGSQTMTILSADDPKLTDSQRVESFSNSATVMGPSLGELTQAPFLPLQADVTLSHSGQNKPPIQNRAVAIIKQFRSSLRKSSEEKMTFNKLSQSNKSTAEGNANNVNNIAKILDPQSSKTHVKTNTSSSSNTSNSANASSSTNPAHSTASGSKDPTSNASVTISRTISSGTTVPAFDDDMGRQHKPELQSNNCYCRMKSSPPVSSGNLDEVLSKYMKSMEKTDNRDEIIGTSRHLHQIVTGKMITARPSHVTHTGPIICDAFESLKLRQATAFEVAKVTSKEERAEGSILHQVPKSSKPRCQTAKSVKSGKSTPVQPKNSRTTRHSSATQGRSVGKSKVKTKPAKKERSRKRSKTNAFELNTDRSTEEELLSGPNVRLIGGIGWHVAARPVKVKAKERNCEVIGFLHMSGDNDEVLDSASSSARSKSTGRSLGDETQLEGYEERKDQPPLSFVQNENAGSAKGNYRKRSSGKKVKTSVNCTDIDPGLGSDPRAGEMADGRNIVAPENDPNSPKPAKEVEEKGTVAVLASQDEVMRSVAVGDQNNKCKEKFQALEIAEQDIYCDEEITKYDAELNDVSKEIINSTSSQSANNYVKQSLKKEPKDRKLIDPRNSSKPRMKSDSAPSNPNTQSSTEISDEFEDYSSFAVKAREIHDNRNEKSPADRDEKCSRWYESIITAKPPLTAKSSAQQTSQGLERSPRFVRKHDSYTLKHRTDFAGGNVDGNACERTPVEASSYLQNLEKDGLLSSDQNAKLVTTRLGRYSSTSYAQSAISSALSCAEEVETIQWKRGNVLGKGAYGTVWCGLTNSGELIAVKMIELNTSNLEKAEMEYAQIQEEVELLKTLKHKNIVGYLGTSLEDNFVSIFMQFVPGGSIASIIARFGSLEEEVFSNYTKQILEGVEYLHANNVIHRDIKGGNIMVMHNGIIKLIDFGCAKKLCLNITSSPPGQSPLLKSMRGTPYWMAPEVVREDGHGVQSDIWSIGCTVFEMATRKPPWSEFPPTVAIFTIGCDSKPIPQLPCKFSETARSFVNACLIRDPNKRPSATQLLRHRFMVNRKRPKTSSLS